MANEDQQQGGEGEKEKPEFVGLVLELRVSIDVMEQADSTTPEKSKMKIVATRSAVPFFMLTQFFILTQFVSFDNFHFLISPVYILKLVDFASADQDPRGR